MPTYIEKWNDKHNRRNGMKHILHRATVFLTVCLCTALLTGCAANIPDLETERYAFYEMWDKSLPIDKILKKAAENCAFDYPEELNLARHPDLLSAADFTGPIICFYDPDSTHYPVGTGKMYIPNMAKERFITSNYFPKGNESRLWHAMAAILKDKDYETDFVSKEKLLALKQKKLPVVYMVLECTGYEDSAGIEYDIGTIYTLTFRTGFYSYKTGELLAWEDEPRLYEREYCISSRDQNVDSNGKRVFASFEDGEGILVPTIRLLCGE